VLTIRRADLSHDQLAELRSWWQREMASD
jgi:hypothetical protein